MRSVTPAQQDIIRRYKEFYLPNLKKHTPTAVSKPHRRFSTQFFPELWNEE